MLLPYQDIVYASGSSAVFEEALFIGRPVVVPPKTLMAKDLIPFPEAGRVATSHSAEAFADALVELVASYPRFHAGATRASVAWRERSGMDRFARALTDLARPSALASKA